MATNKLNRRQFLQALAAGMVVASMPAIIPLAERTKIANEGMQVYEGFRYIVHGGSGPIGDRLVILPPGIHFDAYVDWQGRTFIYPDLLPSNIYELGNQAITLMPWRKYQLQIETMFPKIVGTRYSRLLESTVA